jgi:hypothetical protein
VTHDDEIRRMAAVAETDQVLAAVASMAEQTATYYRTLIAAKVPKALANELTLVAANYIWSGPGCCHEDEG